MSLLFISHAREDKQRIKCLTDALLGANFRLWIDAPLVMGYTSSQIEASISHLLGGRPWQEEIDAGIRAADCVVLFASRRLLEQREIWRREVVTADYERKLITIRLDNVELARFGLGVDFAGDQYTDIFLPEDHCTGLPEACLPTVDLLLRSIAAKLSDTRKARFGDFDAVVSGRPVVYATEEQLDASLMMLNRETETERIARARKAVSLLGADSTACPEPFKSRIPAVELPALNLPERFNSDLSEMERLAEVSRELAARALVMLGLGDPAQRWSLRHIAWPPEEHYDIDAACQYLAEKIVGWSANKPGPLSQSLSAVDRSASEPASASGRYFHYTTVIHTTSKSRRRNAEVIRRLARLLADCDANKVRLLVHVLPVAPLRWSFSKDNYGWLRKVAQSPDLGGIVVLADVQSMHLDQWSILMSLLFQRTPQAARDTVFSIFQQHGSVTMPLAALRERLKSHLSKWPLRPPTKAPTTSDAILTVPVMSQERWADA